MIESVEKTKEDRLLANYNSYISDMPLFSTALQNGGTNEKFFSMTAWDMFQTFALKAFFLDKNLDFSKLCFYKCGLLAELLINKYDVKILDYGIVHLTYTLLTDNDELIKRFAHLKHSNYAEIIQTGRSTPMYILQCLIREDWSEFERAMEIMTPKIASKLKMELDVEYYRAFADKDKGKMEQILIELLAPKVHKRRNNQQIYSDFISQPALGYAKLAWLKGIEVVVNSPLVPRELLTVRPLEKYWELDPFFDFQ